MAAHPPITTNPDGTITGGDITQPNYEYSIPENNNPPGVPSTTFGEAGPEFPNPADSAVPVDTTIDPSQFSSGDAVKSDVSTLEPPEDIDATQIGDYTPYSEVLGEVSPESTVEGRLTGLLSQNSPYMEKARYDATAMSNRNGLLNTSMAVGAAQGAAIDAALPIAQQDAAAFLEQDFRNQGYSNEAAKYMAEQSVQKENLQAGLNQDTNQFNQENTLANDRLNKEAENRSNMQLSAEENRNNFAKLSADLTAQLSKIDNELATNLERMIREYSLLENLDSINGAIYQQMIKEIGTIMANEDKIEVAKAKINALLTSAGVEFAFSSGQQVGGGDNDPLSQLPIDSTPPTTIRNAITGPSGEGTGGQGGQDNSGGGSGGTGSGPGSGTDGSGPGSGGPGGGTN